MNILYVRENLKPGFFVKNVSKCESTAKRLHHQGHEAHEGE